MDDQIITAWNGINPIVSAWMQTEDSYASLDENMQQLVTRLVSNVDYVESGLDTENQIKSYIKNNILEPIQMAEPEVQNAIVSAFSLKDAFNEGVINTGEYKQTIDNIIDDLKQAGFTDEAINILKVSLDTDAFEKKLNHIKDLLSDEFEDDINSLSSNDIELAYQIKADKGSMTFDELKAEVDNLRLKNAPAVNVFDFSDMIDGLDRAKNDMDNLINAMSKLKSGTALTKSELAQLALEYPKLLEASNIFTDGSIEGQKNMLNTMLDMQEQEYDAEIDKKIAELEATKQVLEDQLDLEEQKANLILEIKNWEANGTEEQEAALVDAISKLNDLQGKNYVKLQDGILAVTQRALTNNLEQESDFCEQSQKSGSLLEKWLREHT